MTQYIQTKSKRLIYPDKINPYDILIEDIAWALSGINRFNAHGTHFYSVGKHSILVSMALQGAAMMELAGLLHDASEAYIGDLSPAVKALLPDYQRLENNIQNAIFDKFNVPLSFRYDPKIKMVDTAILGIEGAAIMGPPHWPEGENIIHPDAPYKSYGQFLRQYDMIMSKL